MATSEGRLNFLEGWKSWQIGLAVGAPIALGLAGLWYYNRSTQQSPKSKDDSETKADTASPQASPEKTAEVTHTFGFRSATLSMNLMPTHSLQFNQ